jgi:hypothetical protein
MPPSAATHPITSLQTTPTNRRASSVSPCAAAAHQKQPSHPIGAPGTSAWPQLFLVLDLRGPVANPRRTEQSVDRVGIQRAQEMSHRPAGAPRVQGGSKHPSQVEGSFRAQFGRATPAPQRHPEGCAPRRRARAARPRRRVSVLILPNTTYNTPMDPAAASRAARMIVRRFASAPEADRHDLEYWQSIPASERLLQVWRLSVELWRWRGEFHDERGLCRSVASVRRP